MHLFHLRLHSQHAQEPGHTGRHRQIHTWIIDVKITNLFIITLQDARMMPVSVWHRPSRCKNKWHIPVFETKKQVCDHDLLFSYQCSQLRCVFAWVCFFSICLCSIWMTLIFFSSHQFCFIYLWKNAFLWTRISWISWIRLFNTRHGDNFTWRGKLDLCKNTCFWIITRIAVSQV